MEKNLKWKGRTSQLVNIPYFFLFFWTLFLPIYRYLNTRFRIYSFSDERFFIKSGILSQSIEEIELYRIRDYSIFKPFLLRIFGLGNLTIISSDKSTPRITMVGIKEPEMVMDLLRGFVEKSRKKSGTQEIDFS